MKHLLHFDEIEPISATCLQVKSKEKYGLTDLAGNEICPVKYSSIFGFSDGLAIARIDKKLGVINYLTGKELSPIKYDTIRHFEMGYAPVELDNKWGYIDSTGKEICPIKYDYVENFRNNHAVVKLNNKYGLINQNGDEICKIIYDSIVNYAGEIAILCINYKVTFITPEEKVCKKKFDRLGIFLNGYAQATIDSKVGIINSYGNEVIPIKYSSLKRSKFYVVLPSNYKYGLVDYNNNVVLDFIYDAIEFVSDNIVVAYRNGTRTFISFTD